MPRSLFRQALPLWALALTVATAPAVQAQTQVVLFPGLEGQPLLDAIRAAYRPAQTLGYDVARDSLFAWENRTTGHLTCVYTGYQITLTPGADPSTDAFNRGINTEHTWPQSMGATVEPSRSDMHHLYPVRDNVNSSRNNHPYGEIPDAETDAWYRLDVAQSTIPAANIDEWSEKDNQHPNPLFSGRFEPREVHEGNAARSAFYYRAIYPDRVAAAGADEFFEVQRQDLIAWGYQDPVDAAEYARMEWIAGRQGTENPFVLDSTLARRAFRNRIDTGGGTPPAYPAIVWVNEFHYDNVSNDTGEFIELAVPTSIADMSQVAVYLYDGNGGTTYGTTLQGTSFTQGATSGDVTLYYLTLPVNGLQNGAPDGIAVSVEGEIVQFISYEGVFTATAGPAEGLTSVDIGVGETNSTPVGQSLQLRGIGQQYSSFAWASPSAASPGQVNSGQSFTTTAIEVPEVDPDVLALQVAGANPFRDRTTVLLTVPETAGVRVEAFDAIGRRVAVLHDGALAGGVYRFALDGGGLTPGVYVVRAMVGAQVEAVRVVRTR